MLGLGFLFQPNSMERTFSNQKLCQLVHRFPVSSFRTAGAAIFVSGGKLFNRITLVPRHHPSAIHADGIAFFKEELFLSAELVKSSLHSIGTNAVPKNPQALLAMSPLFNWFSLRNEVYLTFGNKFTPASACRRVRR